MKVLEIKNNLVKIAYDVEDNLALSSFVVIEDVNSPYVAQVVNVKADTNSNFAIVKLLFTFDKEGILKNYNGTIPSLKSTISKLPSNELLDIIPLETPLVLGEIAQQDVMLKIDRTILDNNLLICSNNEENTNTFINNVIKQIDDKVVIFDTTGRNDSESKIVFGKDFKLPLNYDSINFIYDNDLTDVDPTSKAIIQDVFIEVQEYTKTLPEGYIPFETFINVVDQQYRETQIPQLILLKNKLLKYRELNVFAETLKDILNLSIAIDKSDVTVIDISEMTPLLQKEIISYVYEIMKTIDENIYSFIHVDKSNSNKKLLRKLVTRTNIFTTIACSHEYKYLPELKDIAQNLILFAPQTLQHDFASYNTYLNKLNSDEFIVYGAHTQNIPLIVALQDLEDEDIEQAVENNDGTVEEQTQDIEVEVTKDMEVQDNSQNFNVPNIEYPDITLEEVTPNEKLQNPENSIAEETIIEETVAEPLVSTEEIIEEPIPELEPNITIEETPVEEDSSLDEIIEESPVIQEEPTLQDIELEPIEDNVIDPLNEDSIVIEENENNDIYNILADTDDVDDSIIEPNYSENEAEIDYSVAETDVDQNFNPQIQIDENEEMIKQAAKDVDKLMYEKLPNEDEEEINFDDNTQDLTEDDLNLIGDITAQSPIQFEDETPEYEEEEEQPTIVPVYEADDIEEQGQQKLEAGDRVSTPKYGEGIVEKMIKYGNKQLCSIEFPNIGRRLLDPAMTEINKLS